MAGRHSRWLVARRETCELRNCFVKWVLYNTVSHRINSESYGARSGTNHNLSIARLSTPSRCLRLLPLNRDTGVG